MNKKLSVSQQKPNNKPNKMTEERLSRLRDNSLQYLLRSIYANE